MTRRAAGMFEGYTLAYSAAATRQQAAQLFSNAILETEMAVYIGDARVNERCRQLAVCPRPSVGRFF